MRSQVVAIKIKGKTFSLIITNFEKGKSENFEKAKKRKTPPLMRSMRAAT
jgi:hypothetical protein